MKPIHFLYILLVLMLPSRINATNSLTNNCIIHLNKSFYVSGEVLWYKIYLPETFRQQDVSFEIKFVNQQGLLVNDICLKNEGKTYLHGHYKLPFTIPSGQYHLLLFGTAKETKKLVRLANISIPIYNDLQKNPISETTETAEAITAQQVPNLGKLQITLTYPDKVHKREKMVGQISVKDASGNRVKATISVSVKDLLLSGTSALPNLIVAPITDISPTALKKKLAIKGFLNTSSGATVKSNLLGYYSSKEQLFKYNRTDDQGYFLIEFEEFYGHKPIQFIDYESMDRQVVFQQEFEVGKITPLPYNKTIANYLQLSQLRKKAYQYYDTQECSVEQPLENFTPTEWTDYRRIAIQTYDAFKDLPTFCTEVQSALNFQLTKEAIYKAGFQVKRYGDYERNPRPPLFIIDGKLTRNADFVARIALPKIKYLDVFSDLKKLRKQFGPIGQYGTAIIQTKQGNTQLRESDEKNIFDISGYQRVVNFPMLPPDTTTAQPTLRPQIYWHPTLETDATGKVNFSFFQSDDLGTFQIEVVVQSESGEMGYGSWVYEVVY